MPQTSRRPQRCEHMFCRWFNEVNDLRMIEAPTHVFQSDIYAFEQSNYSMTGHFYLISSIPSDSHNICWVLWQIVYSAPEREMYIAHQTLFFSICNQYYAFNSIVSLTALTLWSILLRSPKSTEDHVANIVNAFVDTNAKVGMKTVSRIKRCVACDMSNSTAFHGVRH